MMKRWWIWAVAAAVAVGLIGGGVYYVYGRSRPAAEPPRPRDPGFLLILSIRTLEQNPDTRLSREQIAAILPFIKALKDIPLSDAEAAFVIARHVRRTFTEEQRAALEEARRRFQERMWAQGIPPGAAAGAQALTDEERAQRRTRAFERMIRYLERRMR